MSYVHHTILLVDSDEDMSRFTKLALQRVGVIPPVQVAQNAEEAIGYLSGKGVHADRESYPMPSLLILDLKLSDRSGFDFLSWVRGRQGLKRLPVIVLTQPGPDAEVDRAYELGCNSYLVKPTSFNSLLVMMQSLVQYWLGLNAAPCLEPAPQGQGLQVRGPGTGACRPEPGP